MGPPGKICPGSREISRPCIFKEFLKGPSNLNVEILRPTSKSPHPPPGKLRTFVCTTLGMTVLGLEIPCLLDAHNILTTESEGRSIHVFDNYVMNSLLACETRFPK
jgi:hypothetical protein